MAKKVLILGCYGVAVDLAKELAKSSGNDIIIIQDTDEKINELIDLFSLENDDRNFDFNQDYILRENGTSKYFTKPKYNFKKR